MTEAKLNTENAQGQDDYSDDLWMIRPCEVYLDEFSECSSWRGRLHEKFVYGHTNDEKCQKYKFDYDDCLKYRKTQASEFAINIIERERERRRTRLSLSRANNVWTYRRTPPADWAKPLPENMSKNKLPSVTVEDDRNSCVIS